MPALARETVWTGKPTQQDLSRDQDQRRHEQQVQQLQAELRLIQQALLVKQGELTRLNQEGATLVADLSHARQAANHASQKLARQDPIVARVPALEQQIEVLKHDLDEKELCLALLGERSSRLQLVAQSSVI